MCVSKVDQLRMMNEAAEKIRALVTQNSQHQQQQHQTSATPFPCPSATTTDTVHSRLQAVPGLRIPFADPDGFCQQYACVVVQLEQSSQLLEGALAQVEPLAD